MGNSLFSCTLGVKSSEGFNVVVGWLVPVNPPPLPQTHLKRTSNAPQTHFKRASSAPQTRLKRTSNVAQTQLKRISNASQTHLKRMSNAPQTLKEFKKSNVEKVGLYMLIYLHIPPYTFVYLQIALYTFIYSHIHQNIEY